MAILTNLCIFSATWLLLLLTGIECQVPGEPTIQRFPVIAQTEVQITIGDPADPGGSDVNDFSIQYRIAGSDDDWVLFRTRDGVGGTWVIDGLEASTTYEFRVAAINTDGRGPWTPLSEVTTLDPPTTTGATTTTAEAATTQARGGPSSGQADGAGNTEESAEGGDGTTGSGGTEGGTTEQDQTTNSTSTPVAAIAAPIAALVFIILLVVGYLLLRRTLKSKTRWGKKGRGVQPESNMEKGEEKTKVEDDGKTDNHVKNDNPAQGEKPNGQPEAQNGQSSLRPPYKTHIRAFSAA